MCLLLGLAELQIVLNLSVINVSEMSCLYKHFFILRTYGFAVTLPFRSPLAIVQYLLQSTICPAARVCVCVTLCMYKKGEINQ